MGLNSVFYILDPYLEPFESILNPLKNPNQTKDDKIYLRTFLNLLEIDQGATFKILTDRTLEILKEMLIKDSNTDGGKLTFNISDNYGKVDVIKYPSKMNKYPNKIHDRWFLLKKNDEFKGLHLGPSLDDFREKDCTITLFDQNSSNEAGERFEQIWEILSFRNLK